MTEVIITSPCALNVDHSPLFQPHNREILTLSLTNIWAWSLVILFASSDAHQNYQLDARLHSTPYNTNVTGGTGDMTVHGNVTRDDWIDTTPALLCV
jgi:hypothetical protein